jgi:hypothetical protein
MCLYKSTIIVTKSEWFSMFIYLILVLLPATSDDVNLVVRMILWYDFVKNETLFLLSSFKLIYMYFGSSPHPLLC